MTTAEALSRLLRSVEPIPLPEEETRAAACKARGVLVAARGALPPMAVDGGWPPEELPRLSDLLCWSLRDVERSEPEEGGRALDTVLLVGLEESSGRRQSYFKSPDSVGKSGHVDCSEAAVKGPQEASLRSSRWSSSSAEPSEKKSSFWKFEKVPWRGTVLSRTGATSVSSGESWTAFAKGLLFSNRPVGELCVQTHIQRRINRESILHLAEDLLD